MTNSLTPHFTQPLAFVTPQVPLPLNSNRCPSFRAKLGANDIPRQNTQARQSQSALTQLFSELEEGDAQSPKPLHNLTSPTLIANNKTKVSHQWDQQNGMRQASDGPMLFTTTANQTAPRQSPNPSSQWRAVLKMARLNAAPMGAGLVGLGAFGARKLVAFPLDLAAKKRLGLSTLLTVMVTASSMLINDYFDWQRGVDNAKTKPNRPLVTGEVTPERVKNVLKGAYAAQLALLCLVDRAPIRLWIVTNALLTHFYSEHLKPITGVKNATCAAVVAMALGLGAMAITGNPRALNSVWRPMAVVAGSICHREMVMDIKDRAGDASAGVRTVPVVVGNHRALSLSFVPLAVSLAVAATAPDKTARIVASSAMLSQGALSVDAQRRDFDPAALGRAIELAPACLLAALVSLTQ